MCLNPGHILQNRYQIVGILGKGGFAITYTANDMQAPATPLCVVKEILPPQSNDARVTQKAQKLFKREASSLELLGRHLQIPELIDDFQEQQKFYIVQEYIDGHPLKDELISDRPWSEAQVAQLLREILEIIVFVHDNGVIHRDITPSNLIRRNSGQIVLIDFGAVKEIGSLQITASGQTKTTTIGTRGYAPPEQLDGQPKLCSDIYAVGIIAIQAITGLDIDELLPHTRTGERVWHYSADDRPIVQISGSLKKVLNRMVRYHFNDRYQSAGDVLHDLRSLTPLQIPQPPLPPPPPKRRVWLFVAIAILVSVATFVIHNLSQPKTCPSIQGDAMSCGEEILVTTSSPRLKQRGVEEFAKSNYQSAFTFFKQSWKEEDSTDPETLIYMNNALLKAKNADYYTIAVAVPILKNQNGSVNADSAKELLRGVAQAQTQVNLGLIDANDKNSNFPGQEFIQAKSIKGKGLRVVITDDANVKTEAIKIASSLVKQPEILGVVGHYASEMTVSTVDIYDQNNLVLISPASTTEELTEKHRKIFFRTSYSTRFAAQTLAKHLMEAGKNQATVLYNPGSSSGSYFTRAFKRQFQDDQKGKIVRIRDFDLSKKEFNAPTALKEIQQTAETAIVLSPDGQVTNSLNNAIAMITANRDRNWIAGIWVLYKWRTLEAVSQLKSFEKLVISVPWHPLSSVNKRFPQQAQKLWGGTVNTDTALAYDATAALIKAMEMQEQPSREGMHKTLSLSDFKLEGGTGTIQFDANGDRQNPPSQLVHIVKCEKERFRVTFVPIKYATAAEAGLKCD
ncbi:MAG: protein kinase domain-containing protein [Microcoleus sp.]